MGKYADLLKDLTENEEVDTVSTVPDESAGVAAANEAGMKLLDNVMWGAQQLAGPLDYLRSVGRVPPGVGGEPLPETQLPSGNEALAMLAPGDTQANLAEIAGRREANSEQYPWATLGANVGADYLTLQGLRSGTVVEPARRFRVTQQNIEAFKKWQKESAYRKWAPVDPKAKEVVVNFWNRNAPKIGQTSGRIAETGAEGAFIAALNDADPMQTASYAAASRAAAAPSMWAAQKWMQATPLGKWATVASGAVLITMAQDILPYVKGSLDKAEDLAIEKALFMGGMGIAGGMAYGRIRNNFADTKTGAHLMDAITTFPRTGVLRLLSSWNENPEGMAEAQQVVDAVAADATSFPDDFRRRLERGLTGARDLPEVVQELKANGKYAKLIDDALGKVDEAKTEMQGMVQQGQNYMQQGQALIQQGMQEQGQALIERGQQMIEDGKAAVPGLVEQGQQMLQQGQTAAQPYMDRGQQMLQQGQAAMSDFLRQQPPVPQGANPLGVPDDILAGAMQRGQAVPQEQAFANAQNEMAKQMRDQILSEIDANPGKIPKEKEARIRRLLADRNAVTPQTLEEINALLRSD
jgi:hypothetical protein